jgi:hypothetical protein
MKKILVYINIYFLMQVIMSCASSREAVNYSYQKIDATRQDASREIWTYRYSIADGLWEEIKVYVLNENQSYVINVEMNSSLILPNWGGNLEKSYVYYYMKSPPNFVSETRVQQGRVYSLEEAVETALSWYIEDNKVREK